MYSRNNENENCFPSFDFMNNDIVAIKNNNRSMQQQRNGQKKRNGQQQRQQPKKKKKLKKHKKKPAPSIRDDLPLDESNVYYENVTYPGEEINDIVGQYRKGKVGTYDEYVSLDCTFANPISNSSVSKFMWYINSRRATNSDGQLGASLDLARIFQFEVGNFYIPGELTDAQFINRKLYFLIEELQDWAACGRNYKYHL